MSESLMLNKEGGDAKGTVFFHAAILPPSLDVPNLICSVQSSCCRQALLATSADKHCHIGQSSLVLFCYFLLNTPSPLPCSLRQSLSTMDTLPYEILLLILDRLDRPSLLSATRTSQIWNKILSPFLWRDIPLHTADYKGSFRHMEFWTGVQRFGPCVEKLSISSYDDLGPLVQLQDQEDSEGEGKASGGQGSQERRPYLSNLKELGLFFSEKLNYLDPLALDNCDGDIPQGLLKLLRDNPGLKILRTSGHAIRPEWSYKRLLSPFVGAGKEIRCWTGIHFYTAFTIAHVSLE
jgi:hypothetical protein